MNFKLTKLFCVTMIITLSLILWVSGSVFASDHPVEVQEWLDMVKEKYGGTTITVSMGPHPSTNAFRAMVDEFTELTGIKVQWDLISSPRLRPFHMAQATGESSMFDVWMTDGFYISEYVEKDTIIPIKTFLDNKELTPEWFDFEDIIEAYKLALVTVNDEVYAVPSAGESRFIGYRKDLLEQYNIEPPQTTEDLLKAAKFCKEEVPEIHGMVSRAVEGNLFASGWLHVLYQFSEGWIDQENGEILADSPEVIESLKYWIELLRTGPSDIATYDHEAATSTFMRGGSAFWFDATAIAVWIIDPEESEVYDKVGFIPPPEGPKGRFGGLAGWSLSIPKYSDQKEAAWAFIVWMTSRYNGPKYMENGGVLVRDSLLNNPEITGVHPEMYEALDKTFEAAANLVNKGLVWIPPFWLSSDILAQAGNLGNKALIGDITEEEACKQLADRLRDMQEQWQDQW
jgi:multiple sugar transport system substrate-binding protein